MGRAYNHCVAVVAACPATLTYRVYTSFLFPFSALDFGKKILTTEKNKSLSQRTQRFNAGFSLCFFLCVLCGYLFLKLVRCVHTIGHTCGVAHLYLPCLLMFFILLCKSTLFIEII